MSRELIKEPYEYRECDICEKETIQEFEAGNGNVNHADEPASVDSYSCNECGASFVFSSWSGEFEYSPEPPRIY